MRLLKRLRSIVHWIRRREEIESSLDAELRSYVDISAAEKVRDGMPADEARRRAVAEIGGMDVAKERVRSERHGASLDAVWRDIRIGLRSLLASPRFTMVALLTLTLTIGGITTIFTLVESVILRPLPYPESDRFVELTVSERGAKERAVPQADFLDWKQRARTLDLIAGIEGGGGTFDEDANPKGTAVSRVTPDLFPMLVGAPILGRTFRADDFIETAPLVIVISHSLWQSHYGGSPDAIGKKVRVSGSPAEVIGVMPPSFGIPSDTTSNWVVWRPAQYDDPPDRADGRFSVIGRLAPGVTLASARTEMNAINSQLATEHPETYSVRTLEITPVLDNIIGDARRLLWIFFAAVSCVLLIGIANLSNLQGIRNVQREREMSVRAALGGSRAQLVRQLLIESTLLSLCGGVAGTAAAWAATRALVTAIPASFPRVGQISMDAYVLMFAVVVSALTGLSFGLLPALQASKQTLNANMNVGAQSLTIGAKRGRTQRILIAVETALAIVLLVTGGLLANSFWKVLTKPSGFEEKNLWSFRVTLPYFTPAKTKAYWDVALQRVRATPQVDSAAMGEGSIFSGGSHMIAGIIPEGREPGGKGLTMFAAEVSSKFFASIGTKVIRGREFLESDTANSERVVVLNESAAKAFWPHQDPLGKRLRFTRDMVVVGIVQDYQNNELHSAALPQMFRPVTQVRNSPDATLFVRTSGDARFAAAVRDSLTSLDKSAKVEAASMTSVRWAALTQERFRTFVLLAFALVAMALALVGIWGVVSYTVVQRNREIALRLALGANRVGTVLLMARQALLPAAAGLIIGTIASLWVARVVEGYLFRITPTDPLTFAVTFGVLAFGAICASILPACRAVRMDPMVMLRHD